MQVGHGEVDHGFGAVRVGFVVADKAPVEHQPAVGPLDRQPFRYQDEAPGPGGASGDFHVDAEGGGMFDEVLAVAAIDPASRRSGWAAATRPSSWVPESGSMVLTPTDGGRDWRYSSWVPGARTP